MDASCRTALYRSLGQMYGEGSPHARALYPSRAAGHRFIAGTPFHAQISRRVSAGPARASFVTMEPVATWPEALVRSPNTMCQTAVVSRLLSGRASVQVETPFNQSLASGLATEKGHLYSIGLSVIARSNLHCVSGCTCIGKRERDHGTLVPGPADNVGLMAQRTEALDRIPIALCSIIQVCLQTPAQKQTGRGSDLDRFPRRCDASHKSKQWIVPFFDTCSRPSGVYIFATRLGDGAMSVSGPHIMGSRPRATPSGHPMGPLAPAVMHRGADADAARAKHLTSLYSTFLLFLSLVQ